MDEDTLKWVIPIIVGVIGGIVGWIGKQFKYRREVKRQAVEDADKAIKATIAHLEELITKTKKNGNGR